MKFRLTRKEPRARRYKALLVFVILTGIWTAGCGTPILEPPECLAARTPVREFYSVHFGNDMAFSAESLRLRERFLSRELVNRLQGSAEGTDPFTTGDTDHPKAFRAGECRVLGPNRVRFDIVLFWKDDVRSEQRKIGVEVVKNENEWLIDKIER